MGHGAQTPPGGGNGPDYPNGSKQGIDYGKLGDPFFPRFRPAENFSRSTTYGNILDAANERARDIKKLVRLDEFLLYLLIALSTAGLTFSFVFSLIYLYSDRPELFWYFVGVNFSIVVLVGGLSVLHWFVFRQNSIKLEHYIKTDVIRDLVEEIQFANERMRSPEPTEASEGLMRLLRVITENQLQYRQIWLIWVVMKLTIDKVRKTAFYLGFITPVLMCLLPLALRTGVEMAPDGETMISIWVLQFSEIKAQSLGLLRLAAIFMSGMLAWLVSVCLFWSIYIRVKKALDLENEKYYFTDIKERLERIFDTEFGGVVGDRDDNPRYQFLPYSFDMTAFIVRQFFKLNVEVKRYRDRGPQGI